MASVSASSIVEVGDSPLFYICLQIVRLQHEGVEFGEIEMLWRTNLQQQVCTAQRWRTFSTTGIIFVYDSLESGEACGREESTIKAMSAAARKYLD